MSNDRPRHIPVTDLDHEQYLDHSIDLVARVRAAKQAAQREMETFGDVSEYEIRKIYGQKTELPYPDHGQNAQTSAERSRSRGADAKVGVLEPLKERAINERQGTLEFQADAPSYEPPTKEE
jgi:hypothetical protein